MRTLIELFETSVAKFPNNPLLWEKPKDRYLPSTYLEIRRQVYEFAAGLLTLGLKKVNVSGYFLKGRTTGWLAN